MILKRTVLVFKQKDIAYVSVDHKDETMVHVQYKNLHRIFKFDGVDSALMLYLFCEAETEKIIKMKKGRYVIKNDHQIISMNLN
jgi:hypothetical protein